MAYKKGKYNFTLDGVKYTDISGWNYEGNETNININVAGTAQMLRQYIAAKYPKFYGRGFSWVKSESYSGGDSIDVYFNRIPKEYFEKISKELDAKFEEGSFNGMNDSYTYTKGTEQSKEGFIVSYGTKYLFVYNEPPYDAPEKKLPAPDWDKILATSTPKPSTSGFKSTSSTGSGFANKGELLMTRAGWEFYKKNLDDGRIVYNLWKLKETPPNKGDWNEIKGELYIGTGFKWGKYGNFEKWGEIKNEYEVLEQVSTILYKYYTGKSQDLPKPKEEEPQPQSKESIERAIKALQIIADLGDESAKRQIISLKYLL